MDDERYRPGLGTIAVVLIAGALVVVGALAMTGGQVSTILSNVGAAVTSGESADGPVGNSSGDADEPADGGQGSAGGGQIAAAAPVPPDLLIIRTGELELEVADLPAAVAAARRIVADAGGYVSASEESAAGDDATASVVYRIPADGWDDAMASLRGLAHEVRHATVGTEAVTSEVIDLDARITNLRASEAALQKIMDQATRIADVLEVQAELTTVRGEIERLVAQKQSLEERAAFGTLTVVFRLPAAPVTEEVKRGWDPAADADRATATIVGVGQNVASAGIWLGIVGLPILLVAAVAAVVGWRIGRVVWRRRPIERGPSW
jgi:hypothetical protein